MKMPVCCGARVADERDRAECIYAKFTRGAKEAAGAESGVRDFGALGDAGQPIDHEWGLDT